jgi:hypothetical protein
MRFIITIIFALTLSGCTGMLLGGNVSQPPPSSEEDEKSKK